MNFYTCQNNNNKKKKKEGKIEIKENKLTDDEMERMWVFGWGN